MLIFAALAFTQPALADPTDSNLLPIGRSGTVEVKPGDLVDTRTGKSATLNDVADAAKGKEYVFLGEQHATTLHQQEEAAIIDRLANHGRHVTVGLEMFQRPKQDVLDQWSAGKLSEEEFITTSDWKHQWGFDYAFYRPVFEVVRTNHLGLVGLNVPHEWVHTVATAGFPALPTSARIQLPGDLFLGNKDHHEVFDSLMGGHQPGNGMDKMYAAQVLWDTGMADTSIKYRATQPKDKTNVFVVVAGSGHVMYGQGINYRVRQRKEGEGISVVMLTSDKPVNIARGIADFVLVTKPVDKKE